MVETPPSNCWNNNIKFFVVYGIKSQGQFYKKNFLLHSVQWFIAPFYNMSPLALAHMQYVLAIMSV